MLSEDGRQRYRVHVGACRVQLASNVNVKPCLVYELVCMKLARLARDCVVVLDVAEADVSVDAETESG